MLSFPNVGPTIDSSTIFAGAGNEPALNTVATSSASCIVNDPEIEQLPFIIGSLMIGHVNTKSSIVMAIKSFTRSVVQLPHSTAASGLKIKET